ncbi:MAG TPA: enoyl-CoA hydratase-related protein [Steroidobacteraceae bacterium]|nr:enoyl-CoA hydratase-related protein [Steroidobacteraceae bacterium]
MECERDGGVTLLRLARPERMNALTDEIKSELCELIPQFFDDPTARCLLITGSGAAFCAGGELRSLATGPTPAQTRGRLERSHRWAHLLMTGEKPVIMAVNGAAAGAGFGLALLGDITVASDSAYFLPGFTSIAVAADLAVALTLPRAVGVPRAKEILFRNRRIEAPEAAHMGLISAVYPAAELLPAAMQLARQLACGPTLSIGLTKSLIHQSYELSLEGYLAAEIAAQMQAFSSSDCREGVDAFFAKRSPRFTGS